MEPLNPPEGCSCCSDAAATTTTATYVVKQVYSGNGDPNAAGFLPEDPTIDNIYNNLDVPGETWWWAAGGAIWI